MARRHVALGERGRAQLRAAARARRGARRGRYDARTGLTRAPLDARQRQQGERGARRVRRARACSSTPASRRAHARRAARSRSASRPQSIQALLAHARAQRPRVAAWRPRCKRWGWPRVRDGGHAARRGATCSRARRRTCSRRASAFAIGGLQRRAVPHVARRAGAGRVRRHVAALAARARRSSRTSGARDRRRARRARSDVDVLVVESNHDEGLLESGPYPWHLKRRVAGSHGHLSNRAAGDARRRTCVHRGAAAGRARAPERDEQLAGGRARVDAARAASATRYRGALAVAPQHGVVGPFGDLAGLGGQLALGL